MFNISTKNFKSQLNFINYYVINSMIKRKVNRKGYKFLSTSSTVRQWEYDNPTKGNMTQPINYLAVIKKCFENPEEAKRLSKQYFGEFRKFYEEHKEKYYLNDKRFDANDAAMRDIIFKFEEEEHLQDFVVTTDSSNDIGYSLASFKITQEKTGLFSGVISTDVRKSDKAKYSGFANITSKRVTKSFKRPSFHDWSFYTHLVLKIRGDGRTWCILLHTPNDNYSETWSFKFMHPLYTRGGPYWQIARIPFSHFYFSRRGKMQRQDEGLVPLNKIARLGLTLADSVDGPFRLEIDYIGLERVPNHKEVSPYEEYYSIPYFV